jgi:hypothetical protein
METSRPVIFARWLFRLAGLLGLLVLLPQYVMENEVAREAPVVKGAPTEITRPEYYYGFIGVAVAWQLAFIVIGQDPLRYRPLMLPSVVEKLTFAGAAVVLFIIGRVTGFVLVFGLVDMSLGVLFLIAWWRLSAISSMPDK